MSKKTITSNCLKVKFFLKKKIFVKLLLLQKIIIIRYSGKFLKFILDLYKNKIRIDYIQTE